MRKFILFIILLLHQACLWALPANPKPFVFTQSDGTFITVILWGDENYHYYTDLQGTQLILEDGMFRQATIAETMSAKSRGQKRIIQREDMRAKRRTAEAAPSFIGHKRGLVILVNFSDKKMLASHTKEEFDNLFNQKGYSKNQHIGSVRDYFLDQSYGQLTIDFDVVGPYTLSKPVSYYGENDEDGIDKHAAEMAIEAVKLAHADVNYSNYDWNGDGCVDQIYIIYAGVGESSTGAPSNTIWPHEWRLSYAQSYNDGSGIQYYDGVKIDNYACSSELLKFGSNQMTSIGSAVHEFSHCLGLPDFYHTEGGSVFGMNVWSVMSMGCYLGPSGNGEVPAGYTAYERMFAGWLTPTELKSPCIVQNVQSIETTPEAYIIYNDANRNEYYLLQNFQKERWNSYGYGHGMIVIHVDYDEEAWRDNIVNNTASHQRCTIVHADNYNGTTRYDLSGDPYPGVTGNTSLTDTSTPAATLYNYNKSRKKLMGKAIEDITERNNLISFRFMGASFNDISQDVNKDGTIDTQDILAIYSYMRTKGSDAMEGTLEDVNSDGVVDSQDVLSVYEIINQQ